MTRNIYHVEPAESMRTGRQSYLAMVYRRGEWRRIGVAETHCDAQRICSQHAADQGRDSVCVDMEVA